jgi:hypothetical protein
VIQALERNKMATHQCPEEEKLNNIAFYVSITNVYSGNTVQLFLMDVNTSGL